MSPLVVVTSLKAGRIVAIDIGDGEAAGGGRGAGVFCDGAGRQSCDHRSIISASDGDGDGLFRVVSGGEGVSVIDGVTGIEGIDGGVGVIECVSPGAAG